MFLSKASSSEVTNMYTQDNPLDLFTLYSLKYKNGQHNCFNDSCFLSFSFTLALPLEGSPVIYTTDMENGSVL